MWAEQQGSDISTTKQEITAKEEVDPGLPPMPFTLQQVPLHRSGSLREAGMLARLSLNQIASRAQSLQT